MKKLVLLFALIVLLPLLLSCDAEEKTPDSKMCEITDSLGNTFKIPENPDVVACYGSFAECWTLAGGKLLGTSDDAVKERHLNVGNAQIIGSVKEPNLEMIVSLNPDYVILSSELTSHISLKAAFDSMGIAYGYFTMDTFQDYDAIMQKFCNITGRNDLYKENVTKVKAGIEKVMTKIPQKSDKTFLLMRVFSSGIKVKADNLADSILREMHLTSITDKKPSLLNDLSIEAIINENPDYIFVLTMGDEKSALSYLSSVTEKSPAWKELKAIKNGNFKVLPKELFHYKPNNRWNDSYEYMAKILYP